MCATDTPARFVADVAGPLAGAVALLDVLSCHPDPIDPAALAPLAEMLRQVSRRADALA
jgi:hypothetical protein